MAACLGHLQRAPVRSKHKAKTLAICAESSLFLLEKDQPQDPIVEGRPADVLCGLDSRSYSLFLKSTSARLKHVFVGKPTCKPFDLRLSLHYGHIAAGLPLRHCRCSGNTRLHGSITIHAVRIGAAVPPGSRGTCHLQNVPTGCATHQTVPGFFPQKVKRRGHEANKIL